MIGISKPIIGEEEILAVNEVLKSGMIVQGEKVKQLEELFAHYCGTKYSLALNSGTAAIHAALYGLGISSGDEVITTPFTFVATANPILMMNAKVVFCDVNESDFNIDVREVEKKITKNTKCILPVNLYGQIYDYPQIKEIADKHKLRIVEDACQSVGAQLDGVKSGKFGDVAAFSLYATKNIMCGEGGMITTDSEEIYDRIKLFRHHGQSEKTRYEYYDLGYNYRLTDIAAAIAIEQLKKIDILNGNRIENAQKYLTHLKGIAGLILPKINPLSKHVFHQFTVRITKDCKHTREEIIQHLKEKDILTAIYYPKPLHLHPHFKRLGFKEGDFPVAEMLANEVLSLPVHPSLTSEEVYFIINTIKQYVG